MVFLTGSGLTSWENIFLFNNMVSAQRFFMAMLLFTGNCRVLPPSLRKGTKRRQNGKRPAEKKTDDIATFCNKECKLAFISI